MVIIYTDAFVEDGNAGKWLFGDRCYYMCLNYSIELAGIGIFWKNEPRNNRSICLDGNWDINQAEIEAVKQTLPLREFAGRSLEPSGKTGLGAHPLFDGPDRCEDHRVHRDVGVLGVVEDPEEPVQPHVDRGGLQHGRVPGLHGDPAAVDLGQDVAVAHQHGS